MADINYTEAQNLLETLGKVKNILRIHVLGRMDVQTIFAEYPNIDLKNIAMQNLDGKFVNDRRITCLPYKLSQGAEASVRAARYDPMPHEASRSLAITNLRYAYKKFPINALKEHLATLATPRIDPKLVMAVQNITFQI